MKPLAHLLSSFCLLLLVSIGTVQAGQVIPEFVLIESGQSYSDSNIQQPKVTDKLRTRYQEELGGLTEKEKKRLSRRILAFSAASFALGLSSFIIFSSEGSPYYSPNLTSIGVGFMVLGLVGVLASGIIAMGEEFSRKSKKNK